MPGGKARQSGILQAKRGERKTENFKVSNNRDVEKNYNEKLTEGFGRLEVISELRAVQGNWWGWGRISED